jgi:hypothetical protein
MGTVAQIIIVELTRLFQGLFLLLQAVMDRTESFTNLKPKRRRWSTLFNGGNEGDSEELNAEQIRKKKELEKQLVAQYSDKIESVFASRLEHRQVSISLDSRYRDQARLKVSYK